MAHAVPFKMHDLAAKLRNHFSANRSGFASAAYPHPQAHGATVERVGQGGFTLLELIVAMTLVSLIVTLLFGALRLGVRAWDGGIARAEAVNEVQLTQDWIRRELNQMRPIVLEDKPGEPKVAFVGEPNFVRFVAPLPAHRGGAGLYVLTIGVAEDEERRRLMLRYQIYHPDTGGFSSTDTGRQLVLLDDIEQGRFAYFGAEEPERARRWYGRWNAHTHLPDLVRLDVKLADDQRAHWTPLVVAPKLDGGVSTPRKVRSRSQPRPSGGA